MTTWHPGLYVAATPIGNLEDLTPRVQEALRQAVLVAAEDTRVTGRLVRSAGGSARIVSLTEHNVDARTPEVLTAAREGVVVLASDAGTPGVSDPGARLIAAAHREGVRVVPLPGPSALAAAISAAGFDAGEVVFVGFLPRQRAARQAALRRAGGPGRMVVAFESPNRLGALLADIAETLRDPEVVVCRELTKVHEEVVRGRARELASRFAQTRGEVTVVIGPTDAGLQAPDLQTARELLAAFRRAGAKRAAAAAEVARLTGAPRDELYALWDEGQEP